MSSWAVDLPKQGFGLQIGWAQPIVRLNSPDTSIPEDSLANTIKLNGFKVGVVYDASYIAGFGSTIGVNYTFGALNTKWAKMKDAKMFSFSERQQYLYHELELFVDWQYKFEIAKETYLMLYTGPSMQVGMTLKNKYEQRNDVTDQLTEDSRTFNAYTSDQPDEVLSRLNITWGVGAGFQYKRYFLRGGYDFGLINPYKNKQFENERYTRGRIDQWSIKLGIYLWYGN